MLRFCPKFLLVEGVMDEMSALTEENSLRLTLCKVNEHISQFLRTSCVPLLVPFPPGSSCCPARDRMLPDSLPKFPSSLNFTCQRNLLPTSV